MNIVSTIVLGICTFSTLGMGLLVVRGRVSSNNKDDVPVSVRYSNRLPVLIGGCALFSAIVGLIALVGWALELPVLASLGSGLIPVAPSTALLFVLYGLGLVLSTHLRDVPIAYWSGISIYVVGGLLSGVLLVLSLLGIRMAMEHLGFHVVYSQGELPVGHMSPVTAFCFLLASVSHLVLFLSTRNRRWLPNLSRWIACCIVVTGAVLVLAYLYGTPLLYGSGFIPPAVLTSLAFMGLGAALLLLASSRAVPSRPPYKEPATRAFYILILISGLLAFGIVFAGYLYFKNFEIRHRTEVERQLSAIADLKADELVHWRKERLGDGELFYNSENLAGLVNSYLQEPQDREIGKKLRSWMQHVYKGYQYDWVFLLDADGKERMSVPNDRRPISRHTLLRAAENKRAKQVLFEDFYRNDDGRIYLAILVPILDRVKGQVTATLVLRIDPAEYLYPFLRRWPTMSKTAETLLVRREGNDVLFLNELRFQQNTALILRKALDQSDLPASQAVRGRQGIVEGKDYRGVPVIADVRPIPGSPWFLISRMDISEVYGPMREKLWMMIALIGALLAGAGGGLGLVWRRQQTEFYREQCEASEALRESEEQFRLLVEGVKDYAILMLDISGSVKSWNQGAERINGYREEEIIGRHFSIFYTSEDSSQEKPQRDLRLALDNGSHEDEGWRVRKDGSRFWANAILTALRDKDGTLRGFSKVTRDITDQRRTQQEREMIIDFLGLVNGSTGTRDLIQAAVSFFQQQSGCEAVGIRLREGDDFPYYEARGFPPEFVQLENSLCAKDSAGCVITESSGNPVIECMCGNVVCGRFNPAKPFFTKHGSFWSNNTTELLRSTTEADRQARTRNRCNGEGYESVALLPLRLGEERLGLLQLNDRRIGMFSEETIASWERLADHLAVALSKFRAEEGLRKSEERYRNTLDGMIEGCQILGFDWAYLYINAAAARHGRRGRDEFPGHTLMDLFPGIDETEMFSVMRRCMTERTTGHMENEFSYPGGDKAWFDLNFQPVPEGLFVLSYDITERKRAEEERRISEKKYKDLFESTLDGIYQADADGVFVTMNPAGARILGHENPGEVIGRQAADYWRNPKDREAFIAELKNRKKVIAYHMRAKDKNGKTIEIEASSLLKEDENGNFLGNDGILRDVTERIRAEERINRQFQKLSALRTIDLAISASLDIRMTLKVFLEQVVNQLRVDACDVLLFNTHSKTLNHAVSMGFRSDTPRRTHVQIGQGYAGAAALEKRIVSIPRVKPDDIEFLQLGYGEGEGIAAYYAVPLVAKAQVKGVLEIFNRSPLNPDEEWLEFLEALALQAAIAIDNAALFENLERSNLELAMAYDSTIEGWSRALDYRDKETEGHSQRVTELTIKLCRAMGMTNRDLTYARWGALLHDIGKLGVPDNILFKPGKLDDDEWKIMKRHPVFAYELLQPIRYLGAAVDIPYCHHEKWDGTGYPRGLKGDQIPLTARIFSIVDVWDALGSDRPYRPAWPREKISRYLRDQTEKDFDPAVTEIFLRLLDEENMNDVAVSDVKPIG